MPILKKKSEVEIINAGEKDETRIIVFTGSEKGIYPYHFALLLSAAAQDADILVVDNSVSQDMARVIPHEEGYAGAFGRVNVLSRRRFSPDAFQKFNYVIAYLGYVEDDEYMQNADAVFVMCDYGLKAYDFIRTVNIPEGKNVMAVFTDKATSKVSEKLILAESTLANDTEKVITDISEEDLAGYIEYLYNGNHRLGTMSQIYREAQAQMVAAVTGTDQGQLVKASKSL